MQQPTIDGMTKQSPSRAGHAINNGTKTSEVSKLRMFRFRELYRQLIIYSIMQKLWCWRCRQEVAMLDEEEYSQATRLYRTGMNNHTVPLNNPKERFKELLDFYYNITGISNTIPNAIMHHRITTYGPPCEKCSKPYRTPQATFCAACGNKRN
jgi:Zn finger protein HypA/HybF involved in hydrogenase expression